MKKKIPISLLSEIEDIVASQSTFVLFYLVLQVLSTTKISSGFRIYRSYSTRAIFYNLNVTFLAMVFKSNDRLGYKLRRNEGKQGKFEKKIFYI